MTSTSSAQDNDVRKRVFRSFVDMSECRVGGSSVFGTVGIKIFVHPSSKVSDYTGLNYRQTGASLRGRRIGDQ